MEFAVVLGWLGSALFLARLVPQPVRIFRTGVSDGVSAQAVLNALVSDIGWLLYGFAAGLPPVWACTALAIPLDVWTLALLRHRLVLRTVVTGAAWGLVMLTAWIVGGALALGTVLGLSVLINHAPQVWTALRGDRLSGIAPATWFLALADASLWGGYGVVVGDPALIAYGVIMLTASLSVLFRLWQVSGREGLRAALAEGVPDPIENL